MIRDEDEDYTLEGQTPEESALKARALTESQKTLMKGRIADTLPWLRITFTDEAVHKARQTRHFRRTPRGNGKTYTWTDGTSTYIGYFKDVLDFFDCPESIFERPMPCKEGIWTLDTLDVDKPIVRFYVFHVGNRNVVQYLTEEECALTYNVPIEDIRKARWLNSKKVVGFLRISRDKPIDKMAVPPFRELESPFYFMEGFKGMHPFHIVESIVTISTKDAS